jgi:hypothetical protein
MLKPAIFLLVAAVLWPVATARAWDPVGHMLTAAIAMRELKPEARRELDEAIGRFNAAEKPDAPYDAISAPCWMDDVRARTRDFNEWHYVNLPFTREGLPVPEGSREKPHIIWGIDECLAVLNGGAESGITKEMAVMILMHLIGDIHQPLHATSRDDQGGNRQPVSNLKDAATDVLFTKGGNLHFFWDTAYRRVFREGNADVAYSAPLYPRQTPVAGHTRARTLIEREAAALIQRYPRLFFPDLAASDATAWALESHLLGYDLAYAKLPPGPAGEPVALTPEYVDAARTCAEERIVLAGYRLADVLNKALLK